MLNEKSHHIPRPDVGKTNETMIIPKLHVGMLNCGWKKHLIMHLNQRKLHETRIENNESNIREHASPKVSFQMALRSENIFARYHCVRVDFARYHRVRVDLWVSENFLLEMILWFT